MQHEADHVPSPSADIKNAGSYTSAPPCVFVVSTLAALPIPAGLIKSVPDCQYSSQARLMRHSLRAVGGLTVPVIASGVCAKLQLRLDLGTQRCQV
jgi:hypothetical protein